MSRIIFPDFLTIKRYLRRYSQRFRMLGHLTFPLVFPGRAWWAGETGPRTAGGERWRQRPWKVRQGQPAKTNTLFCWTWYTFRWLFQLLNFEGHLSPFPIFLKVKIHALINLKVTVLRAKYDFQVWKWYHPWQFYKKTQILSKRIFKVNVKDQNVVRYLWCRILL